MSPFPTEAKHEQLITTEEDEEMDRTIRFDRILEDREVVYFWLPTTKESISAARLGRVILLCLRVAAHDRKLAGEEKRQVYLLIDEFQKLASEQFEKLLQQARSDGIAAILANQSLEDLKSDDHDLMQTVRTNTRTKMHFSVTEPDEIQAFRELSGEELQTYGMGDVEEIRLRISTKELAALSDHPKRFLLQITSGSGYSQFGGLPIPVETDWPIPKQLADERLGMAWPTQPRIPTRPVTPSRFKAKAAAAGSGTEKSNTPGAQTDPASSASALPPSQRQGRTKSDPKTSNKMTGKTPLKIPAPPELKQKMDDQIRGFMDD
jgi:hypothetical protein